MTQVTNTTEKRRLYIGGVLLEPKMTADVPRSREQLKNHAFVRSGKIMIGAPAPAKSDPGSKSDSGSEGGNDGKALEDMDRNGLVKHIKDNELDIAVGNKGADRLLQEIKEAESAGEGE